MSRHVVEVIRCDFCDVEASEVQPIVSISYQYGKYRWETDVCPTHNKEVEDFFERLTENSHRLDDNGGVAPRTRPKRRRNPDGSALFQRYLTSNGMFACPWQSGEKRCHREFSTPQGLAVHHTRTHGVSL